VVVLQMSLFYEIQYFNMAAIHHVGFVGGSREATHEGPIMVANPCKSFVISG